MNHSSRSPIPAYHNGDQRSLWTVYLDFGGRLCDGGGTLSDAEVFSMFSGVAAYLVQLDLAVTTVEPPRPAGEYTTVRFLRTPSVPWSLEGAVGNCPVKVARNGMRDLRNEVLVGRNPNWEHQRAVAAHETVHSLQPPVGNFDTHENDLVAGRPNLMGDKGAPSIVGGRLSPFMTKLVRDNVARVKDGWRQAHFLKPNGTWTFDWVKIY